MTDLNTLIPFDSALTLQTACSINFRGEIIGIAMQPSTMEYHAYFAIPRPRVAESETAKVPENVRELIRQRWPLAAQLAARPTQPQ